MLKRKTPLKRSRLRGVSKAKRIANTTYALAKAEWIAKQTGKEGYWRCQFVGKPILAADDRLRCLAPANELHHRRGRVGSNLYHKQFFMGCCSDHHLWIHNNAKAARKRGLLK